MHELVRATFAKPVSLAVRQGLRGCEQVTRLLAARIAATCGTGRSGARSWPSATPESAAIALDNRRAHECAPSAVLLSVPDDSESREARLAHVGASAIASIGVASPCALLASPDKLAPVLVAEPPHEPGQRRVSHVTALLVELQGSIADLGVTRVHAAHPRQDANTPHTAVTVLIGPRAMGILLRLLSSTHIIGQRPL
jgi:hypothetical protein